MQQIRQARLGLPFEVCKPFLASLIIDWPGEPRQPETKVGVTLLGTWGGCLTQDAFFFALEGSRPGWLAGWGVGTLLGPLLRPSVAVSTRWEDPRAAEQAAFVTGTSYAVIPYCRFFLSVCLFLIPKA